MSEEELTDPASQESAEPAEQDHQFLRRLLEIAQLTGDDPAAPPIDYSTWGSWLPEPDCERKFVAYRRIQREGMVREVAFEEAKKFYRAAVVGLGRMKMVDGKQSDLIFYLALRHFPPQ